MAIHKSHGGSVVANNGLRFQMVDAAGDGVAGLDPLPVVEIMKPGTNEWAAATGTVTEATGGSGGYGWYALNQDELSSDTDTLGPLTLRATAAGCVVTEVTFDVVYGDAAEYANYAMLASFDVYNTFEDMLKLDGTMRTPADLSNISDVTMFVDGDTTNFTKVGAFADLYIPAVSTLLRAKVCGTGWSAVYIINVKNDDDQVISSYLPFAVTFDAGVTEIPTNDTVQFIDYEPIPSRQAMADAVNNLAPSGESGAEGSLRVVTASRLATSGYTAPDNASIAAIKAKTDTIGAGTITTTSFVLPSGDVTIYAGGDHTGARKIQIVISNYVGASLSGGTGELILISAKQYRLGYRDGTALTGTISQSGSTVTFECAPTEVQTETLATIGATERWEDNAFIYQVVGTTAGDKTIPVGTGRATILPVLQ